MFRNSAPLVSLDPRRLALHLRQLATEAKDTLRDDVLAARSLLRRLLRGRRLIAEPADVDGLPGYRLKAEGSYEEIVPPGLRTTMLVTPEGCGDRCTRLLVFTIDVLAA